MHEKYQVISAAEAALLWQLESSTIRKAISDKRLSAQKSAGTWLVATSNMVKVYGDPKPDTSLPTLGEFFHIQADNQPLEDIGRVPAKTGRHVLKTPYNEIIIIGGYYLRRPGEIWDDFLA